MSRTRFIVAAVLVALAAVVAGWTWDCRGTESVNPAAAGYVIDGPSDGAEI